MIGVDKSIHLDFLVLGAQKAGTTSLHDWLVQHDDILLPIIKETHFFSHESRFGKGINWYFSQFMPTNSAHTLTGEIDPEYLFALDAPVRIKEMADVKKFIVILRQPIQRAYSHYLMTVRRGFDDLPFERAILAEKTRLENDADQFARDHQSYIARSMYSKQIERYISLFPEAQFLFIKFDDLIDKMKGENVYKSICQFIGTSYDTSLVDREKSSNQASTPRWGLIRNLVYRKGERSWLRKVLRSIISDDAKLKLFMLIDKINQRKMEKSEIKPITEFHLDNNIVSEILADLDKVEFITGLSLSNWKESVAGCLSKPATGN